MRCSEIMKTDVECCHLDDDIASVAARMRDRKIGFMPVCDDEERVTGVVTDRDLTIRATASCCSPGSTRVRDVMSTEVISCKPDDDLSVAEDLMARHKKSRIICIDHKGRPVGVISLSDVAEKERPGRAARVLKEVSAREAHL